MFTSQLYTTKTTNYSVRFVNAVTKLSQLKTTYYERIFSIVRLQKHIKNERTQLRSNIGSWICKNFLYIIQMSSTEFNLFICNLIWNCVNSSPWKLLDIYKFINDLKIVLYGMLQKIEGKYYFILNRKGTCLFLEVGLGYLTLKFGLKKQLGKPILYNRGKNQKKRKKGKKL